MSYGGGHHTTWSSRPESQGRQSAGYGSHERDSYGSREREGNGSTDKARLGSYDAGLGGDRDKYAAYDSSRKRGREDDDRGDRYRPVLVKDKRFF